MNEDTTTPKNEVPIPKTYEKPAIETSSDVAGLLTFKGPKGNGKGKGKGNGPSNHS